VIRWAALLALACGLALADEPAPLTDAQRAAIYRQAAVIAQVQAKLAALESDEYRSLRDQLRRAVADQQAIVQPLLNAAGDGWDLDGELKWSKKPPPAK
jgi:hypothetical protein